MKPNLREKPALGGGACIEEALERGRHCVCVGVANRRFRLIADRVASQQYST